MFFEIEFLSVEVLSKFYSELILINVNSVQYFTTKLSV